MENKEKGFVALMATIIISLVLLVMAAEESVAGFRARFNILGTEAKEQAASLAEACADYALASLITDPNYTGNSTATFPSGICHVFPLLLDSPSAGLVTIKTQAEVRGSYTNFLIVANLHDVRVGTPLSSSAASSLNPNVTITSWSELPKNE